MEPTDIRTYLGQHCSIIVRCQACGREHARTGPLAAGPHTGEVSLAGIVYDVQDIVAISARPELVGRSLNAASLLPYAGLAALVATWLQVARH
jgi:hypothetical protein